MLIMSVKLMLIKIFFTVADSIVKYVEKPNSLNFMAALLHFVKYASIYKMKKLQKQRCITKFNSVVNVKKEIVSWMIYGMLKLFYYTDANFFFFNKKRFWIAFIFLFYVTLFGN